MPPLLLLKTKISNNFSKNSKVGRSVVHHTPAQHNVRNPGEVIVCARAKFKGLGWSCNVVPAEELLAETNSVLIEVQKTHGSSPHSLVSSGLRVGIHVNNVWRGRVLRTRHVGHKRLLGQ